MFKTFLHRFIILTLALSILSCDSSRPENTKPVSINVSRAMQATVDSGFLRADKIRQFNFPADHGPHPKYATEWWYFTGNLQSNNNESYGYQLTLFRLGLKASPRQTDSPWRSNQMYMGHLAISDIQHEKHYSDERFSRAAAGLAGAKATPLHVWLGPWSIQGGDSGLFPIQLSAANDDIGIELSLLQPAKELVLQGDHGLSQKSAAAGNASYYYSYTRLPTRGSIRIGQDTIAVSGDSWFDREWSSSALAADQQGWDWFSLQLDDQTEIMFYRIRDNQGRAQKFSSGTLVNKNGSVVKLNLDNTEVTPLSYWKNQQGANYPTGWSLKMPSQGIDLRIAAAFNDQEMRQSVRYWEGSVRVTGSQQGKGYLEMSGYENGQ